MSVFGALGPQAHAQTVEETDDPEEIVVTGTLIPGVGETGSEQPTIGEQDIVATGARRVSASGYINGGTLGLCFMDLFEFVQRPLIAPFDVGALASETDWEPDMRGDRGVGAGNVDDWRHQRFFDRRHRKRRMRKRL